MPMYEYECSACGNSFAELKPMKDCQADQPCPKCSGAGKRVMSRPNWRAFPGSLTYDRMHGFPGGFKAGGTSSGDMKDVATEDW